MTVANSATNTIARAGTPARAIVCAAGIDTPYVRAGRGEAMVIVAADVDARDVQQMIVDLAEHFLVLAAAPAVTEDGRAFEQWLRNFLDGLGVNTAHVLFHASVAASSCSRACPG
jgi:hypothetical protein